MFQMIGCKWRELHSVNLEVIKYIKQLKVRDCLLEELLGPLAPFDASDGGQRRVTGRCRELKQRPL
jgi:hypothetical protein